MDLTHTEKKNYAYNVSGLFSVDLLPAPINPVTGEHS